MVIFPSGNWSKNTTCPICGTANKGPVVLISKDDTIKNNIAEAEQIHVSCLELLITTLTNGTRIIYQILGEKENI